MQVVPTKFEIDPRIPETLAMTTLPTLAVNPVLGMYEETQTFTPIRDDGVGGAHGVEVTCWT